MTTWMPLAPSFNAEDSLERGCNASLPSSKSGKYKLKGGKRDMRTVVICKDGKKRTVMTQQYVSGLYVAIYEEGKAIPTQLVSTLKEVEYHRFVRKSMPDFIRLDSSEIPDKTVVIFRKFHKKEDRDGDNIIAMFPEIQANDNRYDCQSYQHIGQHGAASYSLVDRTKLATAEEYAELKAELEAIGYDLTVRKRNNKKWWEVEQ